MESKIWRLYLKVLINILFLMSYLFITYAGAKVMNELIGSDTRLTMQLSMILSGFVGIIAVYFIKRTG